jgi:hypothetical protein
MKVYSSIAPSDGIFYCPQVEGMLVARPDHRMPFASLQRVITVHDKPPSFEVVPVSAYRPVLPLPRTARLSEVGGRVAWVDLTAASISRMCLRVAASASTSMAR